MSSAIEEAYLLGHIARLGRLNAQERIADLFLELIERLTFADLVTQRAFGLPMTQETLADALGLTSVHINRTLQMMRRAGEVEWRGGVVTIPDPESLARQVGRSPIKVATPD